MEIHLSKPGGQRQGPFTLEQIEQDLAARKYNDADYWAWHEGLTEWVPLYSLLKVSTSSPSSSSHAQSAARAGGASAPAGASAGNTIAAFPPAAPVPGPEDDHSAANDKLPAGIPAVALEQIFAFTTGDGPATWQSPIVSRMLQEIVGQDLGTIREAVGRDVVGSCTIGELLKTDGSISDSVWRVMAIRRPALVQKARDRLYRVCVRTFRTEADTIVALILFYNKEKL